LQVRRLECRYCSIHLLSRPLLIRFFSLLPVSVALMPSRQICLPFLSLHYHECFSYRVLQGQCRCSHLIFFYSSCHAAGSLFHVTFVVRTMCICFHCIPHSCKLGFKHASSRRMLPTYVGHQCPTISFLCSTPQSLHLSQLSLFSPCSCCFRNTRRFL
jgi:hypothetical protein